jgi:diguanylate cyclase (GGDEF)-like protein/PAS domain S-box-containing protein
MDGEARLLIAGDASLTRRLDSAEFEAEGFRLRPAVDEASMLAAFASERPAAVLLGLAGAGDLGLCRAIRRHAAGAETPVLALTAEDPAPLLAAARDAGITDVAPLAAGAAVVAHRLRLLVEAARLREALRESERSLAGAERVARLGTWRMFPGQSAMQWSSQTYRILGHPVGSEASRERFFERVHPAERAQLAEQIEAALQTRGRFEVEHRLALPDGRMRHVRQTGEIVRDESGGHGAITGTIQDVTAQVRTQLRMRRLASYDSLTGLANRALFRQSLERALADAQGSEASVGLLFLDLDRFKQINDTLGHAAGDELLRAVADRLRRCVRASDVVGRPAETTPRATVSRLGGDEFTILLSAVRDPGEAGEVARRVLRELAEPVPIAGRTVATGASVGIAVFPQDGEDAEALLKNADTAMYHAKGLGRNNFQYYSAELNAAVRRRFELEMMLRAALENGELRLAYQPRIDLRERRVVSFEALLRWDHPELGTISPREFIPLAEETGLILPIGDWVLYEACRQIQAWRAEGLPATRVSVNVSQRQMDHRDIVSIVGAALRESDVEPGWLELELTESAMLRGDERSALALRDLRAMGVRIAIDDFGTGYSSLSYLSQFPIDVLKMDRCLVRDLDSDPRAAAVARAIIGMAHGLGLRAVAEGVDQREQAHFLVRHGCDEAQGFLYAGALPPEKAGRLLRGFDRARALRMKDT